MYKRYYLIWTIVLFVTECAIALFIKGGLIRHFVGDILAIILVYCLLRAISNLAKQKAALIALITGLLIELVQALQLLNELELDHIKWLTIVFGSTADPWDVLAYALGFIFILIAEKSTAFKQ